jgi:hypothetical protein
MPTGLISHSRVFISLHLPPKDAESVQQIRSFLRSKCPSEKEALMEDLLSDSKSAGLGILVREHMMNLPLQLLPTMHESLCSDIDWAAENAEDDTEEKDAHFEQLIVVAPFSYVDQSPAAFAAGDESRGKGKRPKKNTQAKASCAGGTKIFDRFDDEVFVQGSSWGFDYSTTTPRGMQSFHVAIVPIETYRQSAASVRALVGV